MGLLAWLWDGGSSGSSAAVLPRDNLSCDGQDFVDGAGVGVGELAAVVEGEVLGSGGTAAVVGVAFHVFLQNTAAIY